MFDGGINKFRDSRKLALNESLDITNANIVSGSLSSIPREEYIDSNVGSVFMEYKDSIISGEGKYLSFTKMNNLLFRSDGNEMQSTDNSKDIYGNTIWRSVGIETPDISVSVGGEVLKLDCNISYVSNSISQGTTSIQEYQYIFVIDDIPYEYVFKCTRECSAVRLTPKNVPYKFKTIKVYRRADDSSTYYLASADSSMVDIGFTDFERGSYTDFVSPYRGKTLLSKFVFYTTSRTQYIGVNSITFKGDGIATIDRLYSSNIGLYLEYGTVLAEFNFRLGSVKFADDMSLDSLNSMERIYGKFKAVKIYSQDRNNGLYKFVLEASSEVYQYYVYNNGSLVDRITGYEIWPDGVRFRQVDKDNAEDATYFTENEINLSWDTVDCGRTLDSLHTAESYSTHMVGEFKYKLTYETEDGIETAGGPESTEIISSGGAIRITIPKVNDPNAKYVKLYRKSSYEGVGSDYLYMLRFDASMEHTYYDNTTIDELGGLIPLSTTIQVPDDLLFLTYYKGRLFGITKGYTIVDEDYNPLVEEYPSNPLEGSIYVFNGTSYTYVSGILKGTKIYTGSKLLYKDSTWKVFQKDESIQNYDDYHTLLYSELGRPTEWLGLSFINFPEPITGLGTCSNGLIIYHKFSSKLLTGTDTDTFSVRDISASQGCINHKSIQEWKDTSICLSKEGLIATDGGSVELITYRKLGIYQPNDILSSAIVGNDYFLLQDDGYILRYNLQDFTIVTYYKPNIIGLNMIDGSLYMVDRSSICYKFEYSLSGTDEYHILTGKITDGAIANLKEYDKVRVVIEGYAYINIYIDGKIVAHRVKLTNGLNTVGIPNEKNKGLYIQFGLRGSGKLHSIEYKVGGRTND